jgi:hypothetical protein
MKTTERITPIAYGRPTAGDVLADIVPVLETVFVAGPPVLAAWLGTVLFALMLVAPVALLVTLVAVMIAPVALVALAGAILATPYLVVRHLHAYAKRHAQRPPDPRRASLRQGVPHARHQHA